MTREREQEIFDFVADFYDRLRNGDFPGLSYREGQEEVSFNVMSRIGDNDILIQEAGVGTGKTLGYLVPLIGNYLLSLKHGERPTGFVLSTSTIALQEQLKQEIRNIEKILDVKVPLPVVIAKGKNNYVCLQRSNAYLASSKDERERAKVSKILTSDNPDRYDKVAYDEVKPSTWEKINVQNLNCRECNFRSQCAYQAKRRAWGVSRSIVVTNHDMLVESQKKTLEKQELMARGKEVDEPRGPIHIPSFLVLDEAHTLEERVISAYTSTFNSRVLVNDFNMCNGIAGHSIVSKLIKKTNSIFDSMKRSAIASIAKNKEESVTDEGRYPFAITPAFVKSINELLESFDELDDYVSVLPQWDKELKRAILHLRDFRDVLTDMTKEFEERDNVYWVTFIPGEKNRVELCTVKRNISHIAARLFKEKGYGKMFTSATLSSRTFEDGDVDISFFANALGLTVTEFQGQSLFPEKSIPSPYNYDDHTLMYLSTGVLSPKEKDHSAYLDSITDEIDTLIDASHGRSLILFTSKADMKEVYDRLQTREHPFKIIIQNDNNSDSSKKEFIEDESSCLLSTGFWEGIDVKGKALEHVIIPKLPFPVVDPIIEAKSKMSGGGNLGFKKVYMPSMLIKLKQGAGRLIRGEDDIGVVSILDSRIMPLHYQKPIEEALPFPNITTDIGEVKEFFESKQKTI